MSDSGPSRTDTVVPEQQAAGTGQAAGGIARAPGSDLAKAETIERMAERLRFYESFDELIQQNISRSGQLMREAGEKRDEAIATIAQSRQQVATERETQRTALTELLDDVMTIQQATERLAHRVSDALEQIEFELEPIGLHDIGALAGRQSGRLPTGFPAGSDSFQSVAEAVDDEYRLGVLGQPRLGTSSMPAPSVPHGVTSSGSCPGEERSTPHASSSGYAVVSNLNDREENPENAEFVANETDQLDAAELDVHASGSPSQHEPGPGTGVVAAPVEARATSWDLDTETGNAAARTLGADSDDLTSVIEPYAEANIKPYAERTEPAGNEVTSNMQVPSDVSDENLESGQRSDDSLAGEVSTTADKVGAGSTLSFDTEPVIANAAGPDVLSSEETASADMGTGIDRSDQLSSSGIDAEVTAVAADRSEVTPDSSSKSIQANKVSDRKVSVSNTVVLPVKSPTSAVPAVELTEQQTTVVLDGVPRAAIALAIQRHILSKPEVLRAEVREYYDHRLTLFVTSRRATTAEDLQDWDGSASWEQIQASPELLELRMVM